MGRPLLYGTTQEFLEYFGLRDLSELPRPEELRALVAAREPEQLDLMEAEVVAQVGSDMLARDADAEPVRHEVEPLSEDGSFSEEELDEFESDDDDDDDDDEADDEAEDEGAWADAAEEEGDADAVRVESLGETTPS